MKNMRKIATEIMFHLKSIPFEKYWNLCYTKVFKKLYGDEEIRNIYVIYWSGRQGDFQRGSVEGRHRKLDQGIDFPLNFFNKFLIILDFPSFCRFKLDDIWISENFSIYSFTIWRFGNLWKAFLTGLHLRKYKKSTK